METGIMFVLPDGTTSKTSDVISVVFELTLGDMITAMLLAMILIFMVVQAVAKAVWRDDKH